MDFNNEMNLRFKAMMQKPWTLLSDRIIYNKREILLTEIQAVDVFSRPTFATNGLIQITVRGKIINLVYSNKYKKDGEIATEYLKENYGDKNRKVNKKSAVDIQREIESLPYKDDWGTKKEIMELPNVLNKDEHIKAITSGFTEGNTWIIVCTDRRVLMLDKGMIYGLRLIDIPLDKINSISHYKGLGLGRIAITDGAVTRAIQNVPNVTVSFFADTVNKEVQLYKELKTSHRGNAVNSTSPADELIKYKQLLDMGALTQEEFDKKKKELLNL